ncbi:NifU family domain-containing protein [Toxoplasma gondii CAST]|uniref:NifU family domain-containing protein n=1 Tax=Toxoplasma gondii CAST TaxID=943122 RepID=A0A425I7R2_TOXGO|nr:NifU family domain-containing protein [Toxoplasma gondii CAST]
MEGCGPQPRVGPCSLRRVSASPLFRGDFFSFFSLFFSFVCLLAHPSRLPNALHLAEAPLFFSTSRLSLLPLSPVACSPLHAKACRAQAPTGAVWRRGADTWETGRDAGRERRGRSRETVETENRSSGSLCCRPQGKSVAFLVQTSFPAFHEQKENTSSLSVSSSSLSSSSLSSPSLSSSSLSSSPLSSSPLSSLFPCRGPPVLPSRCRALSGDLRGRSVSRVFASSPPAPLSSAGPVAPVADNPFEVYRHPMSSPSASSEVGLNSTMVEQVLESVRPYLRGHGGNVKLVELDSEKKIVRLAFKGACSTCPSAHQTLYEGLQGALREVWPDLSVEEAKDDGVWEEELQPLTIESVLEALKGTRPAIERLGATLEVLSVSPNGDIVLRYRGPNAQTIRIGVEMELRDKLPPDLLGSIDIVTEDKPPEVPSSGKASEESRAAVAEQDATDNAQNQLEAQRGDQKREESGQNVAAGLTDDEEEYEGLEPEPA